MRSLDQNSILHCWCRETSVHLVSGGAKISEGMVKLAILSKLGNVTEALDERIVMPSSKYAMTEQELTPAQHKLGFISMDQLLTKFQAWAATDLSLELVSPNEEKV